MRSRFIDRDAVGVGGVGIVNEISRSGRMDERLVLEEHREPALVRGDEFEVEDDVEEVVDFVDCDDETVVGSGLDMRTRSGNDDSGGLKAYTGRESVRHGDGGDGCCGEYNDNIDGV